MSKHTPGPWRWEFNDRHKNVELVGGRPQYDLTVMDFARWGMGGAVIRLRDLSEHGMNIMHRACDRPDWIEPFQGREHHADWCANINHADARLIAAAPELLEALIGVIRVADRATDEFDAARAAIAKATGEVT
ncbi:hypothetical protein [Chitinolyticbacter meiyuanensis]|uniref:hypothetical protein n=1 Tax=Chitinolyticbacter meiyuanensis TaxID=682798 RepID=UPI0011E59DA7|nr:hypothetical protein [Chitinolyticbacter meiyuanensis]